MSNPYPHQAPYVDASNTTDDAASFVSTLPPPSYRSTDDDNDNEFSSPLISNGPPQYAQTPQLLTPSAASTSSPAPDGAEDKIIMTSIPVATGGPAAPGASKSLFRRLKPATKLKIVLLPQSEYNKYFAKDKAGNYLGTEPQREWTEAELDERYAKFKTSLPKAPMRGGNALVDGGGWGTLGAYGTT